MVRPFNTNTIFRHIKNPKIPWIHSKYMLELTDRHCWWRSVITVKKFQAAHLTGSPWQSLPLSFIELGFIVNTQWNAISFSALFKLNNWNGAVHGIQLATIQKPFPARRQQQPKKTTHFHSLSGTRNVSVAGDDDGGVANVVNISSLAFFVLLSFNADADDDAAGWWFLILFIRTNHYSSRHLMTVVPRIWQSVSHYLRMLWCWDININVQQLQQAS